MPRSGKSFRLRLGLESHAVSTLVWKVAPSPPWLQVIDSWSRHVRLDLESLHFDLESHALCTFVWPVSTLIAKVKSRRIHHGLEELFLGRAVSASVWKVTPSPPWSGKSRSLHSERKSRAASTTVAMK